MRVRAGVAVLLTSMMLVATACGGSDEIAERIIESSGEGDVEIDFDDDTVNVTITDEEGNEVVIGSGAGVPAGFPVPVPAGGTVAASVDTPTETGLNVQYDSDAYDSVVAEYESWLAGQGYDDLQTSSNDAAGFKAMQWFSPVAGVFISVSQAGDVTMVTINLTK